MTSWRFGIFALSLLGFLAGVFPLSLFGVLLPVTLFLWWAIEVSFLPAAWAGLAAGLVLGAYTPLPPGLEAAIFFTLAGLLWFGKRWLGTRYLGGDMLILAGGIVAAELSFLLGGSSGGLTRAGDAFHEVAVVGVLILGVFFMERRLFRDSGLQGRPYTI